MSEMSLPLDAYVDEPREVYPNAQLQLVAAEIRYPFAPRLGGDEALAFFASALRDELPIPEPLQEQTVIIGADGPPDVKGRSAFRLASRDRTTAATLAPSRFVLETTAYIRYGAFRQLLWRLFTALNDYGPPAGIERVGLRYIDEIKVHDVTSIHPIAWKPYIHDALLAAPSFAAESLPGMQPKAWNGVLHFEGDEQTSIVVRFGGHEGYAVDPNGPLRLKRKTPGSPFFLFDVDSFWHAQEVITDFDPTTLISTCDQLHRPISSIFERSITDRLRNEVLRKEPIGAERGGNPPQ
jgi:uncharacterized protein (TIGR04255 family)